jgi:hypothetical protein
VEPLYRCAIVMADALKFQVLAWGKHCEDLIQKQKIDISYTVFKTSYLSISG